jgi:ankyrin repeat protein
MSFTGQNEHILDTFCFLLQVCRYLIEAAKSGDVNTTKRWAHCNIDSCTTDDGGRHTPLILAAENGHLEVCRLLLDWGAKVDTEGNDKQTALIKAALNGHLEVCRLLLDRGAKVDTHSWWNNTALIWAAWNGHMSVVKFLVERGADVRFRNVDSGSAAAHARSKGYNAVADWLDSVSRF